MMAGVSDRGFDDTDMSEEEFDRRFAAGVPAEVAPVGSLWTLTAPSLSRGGQTQVLTLPASMRTSTSVSGRSQGEVTLTR